MGLICWKHDQLVKTIALSYTHFRAVLCEDYVRTSCSKHFIHSKYHTFIFHREQRRNNEKIGRKNMANTKENQKRRDGFIKYIAGAQCLRLGL